MTLPRSSTGTRFPAIRWSRALQALVLLVSTSSMIQAWSSMSGATNPKNRPPPPPSRRSFFSQLAFGASALAVVNSHITQQPALALDMDAFVQKELSNEVCDERTNKKCMPKLTDDQALCRFGQPSKETGEACLRAGMSTKRPSGVDAFGKVDRGEYTRCKAKYVDDGKSNNLVKEWNCQ